MVRRLLPIAALLVCTAVYVWAAERGTFVLTDGSRHSGTIVFHGGDHENLINSHLNLGNDTGGPEFTYPVDQVAVIDFAGGRPSPSEFQALPNDSAHLLVLRNGVSQQGHLVNLINGDTVVWENLGGERQQHAIRDVSRIYLNADAARTAYFGGRFNPNVAVAGTTGTATAGSIRVNANQAWTDTGIDVKKGEAIIFSATGDIVVVPGSSANPDGTPGTRSNNYPLPANQAGTLIGKVGSSAPFAIGSISRPIGMPADGRLMLGINDDYFGDNSGAFYVTVTPVTSR